MDLFLLAFVAPAVPRVVVKPEVAVQPNWRLALEEIGVCLGLFFHGLAILVVAGLLLFATFTVLHAAGFIEPVEENCTVSSHLGMDQQYAETYAKYDNCAPHYDLCPIPK